MQEIDDIIAQLETLKARLVTNAETRSTRHVAKMAKNLGHGDVAMCGPFGFVEINVWCNMDGHVTYGENTRVMTVPANQRVTVRREYVSG